MSVRYRIVRRPWRSILWNVANSPIANAWVTRDTAALLRVDGPVSALDVVLAVRRDWPNGTHELCCPRRTMSQAQRELDRDIRYWLHGPSRPRHSIVTLTLAELRGHSKDGRCRSTACPTAGSLVDSTARG